MFRSVSKWDMPIISEHSLWQLASSCWQHSICDLLNVGEYCNCVCMLECYQTQAVHAYIGDQVWCSVSMFSTKVHCLHLCHWPPNDPSAHLIDDHHIWCAVLFASDLQYRGRHGSEMLWQSCLSAWPATGYWDLFLCMNLITYCADVLRMCGSIP